jgi:hypothetical protein
MNHCLWAFSLRYRATLRMFQCFSISERSHEDGFLHNPLWWQDMRDTECTEILSGDLGGCIILTTPWSESASELYRPSYRRLSAKWLPTFADRGCHVFSVTDSHGRILCFLDRSRYFFFQVAPQLYSRGWVDPVPDALLLRKFGSAETG